MDHIWVLPPAANSGGRCSPEYRSAQKCSGGFPMLNSLFLLRGRHAGSLGKPSLLALSGTALLVIGLLAFTAHDTITAARAETADDYLRDCSVLNEEAKKDCERWSANFKQFFAEAMQGDYGAQIVVGGWFIGKPLKEGHH